jgi:tetratricopeptide (TPR) repeat protein
MSEQEQRLIDLRQAKSLAESGELDMAWSTVDAYLRKNPDDAQALLLASYILDKGKHLSVAFHLARRVTELEPNRFEAWNNYGRVADQIWMIDVAERAHKRAISAASKGRDKALSLTNLAALYINCGEFAKAEPLCRQALMADPECLKAKANLGFCQLAARNWSEGWDNYKFSLGSKQRKMVKYRDEPEWDGEKGQVVAIYGEQGLGDEISFASMLPDAIADCDRVILDCDPRLYGLFKRSFPKAHVYGTRNDGSVYWEPEDRVIDASCAMGSLGGIYRRSDEAFTGKPYLTTCPDRTAMWGALFSSKGKPCIGIAWSGGMAWTGAKFRQWTLDDLLPIFNSIDAHWVCLQYKDSAEEISAFKAKHPEVDIVQYPYATLTQDYDDTAALVAGLDRVISMQTAVVHLCGAIGKRCDVFVPKTSQWRYGEKFTSLPWYQSVNVIRQAIRGHWKNTIEEYAAMLETGERRETA